MSGYLRYKQIPFLQSTPSLTEEDGVVLGAVDLPRELWGYSCSRSVEGILGGRAFPQLFTVILNKR